MKNITLSELGANYAEIEFAVGRCRKKEGVTVEDLDLISTLGNRIYSPDTWMGQGYFFWDRACRLIRRNQCSLSMKEAMRLMMTVHPNRAIRKAYEMRLLRIKEIASAVVKATSLEASGYLSGESYAGFIAEELPSISGDDLESYSDSLQKKKIRGKVHLIAARTHAVEFHGAMRRFWHSFLFDPKFFQLFCPLAQSDSLLLDREYYQALTVEEIWTFFESELQMEIPVALLAKIGKPKSLFLREKEFLRKWVDAVDRKSASFPSELFVTVIREIARVIRITGTSTVTFEEIVLWLDRNGCLLIGKNDPDQMTRRGELSEGMAFDCNGISFTLGKELGDKRLTEDRFKVFEIEGHPDKVMKIPNNCFALFVEHASDSSTECIFERVKPVPAIGTDCMGRGISGLDATGRCAVVEKAEPLEHYIWTSSDRILNEPDELLALALANHFFIEEDRGIQFECSLKDLGRTSTGKIVSLKPLKRVERNYTSRERTIRNISGKNLYVAAFIMHAGKFMKHPVGKFYRAEVGDVFNTMRDDIRTRTLDGEHDRGGYYLHADTLRRQSLALIDDCFIQVRNKMNLHDPSDAFWLKHRCAEKLHESYAAWPFASFFPEEIVASLVNCPDLKNFSPDRPTVEHLRYYEKQHERMMEYNRAAAQSPAIQVPPAQ